LLPALQAQNTASSSIWIPAGNNATGTVFQGSESGAGEDRPVFRGPVRHASRPRITFTLYYAWQQDARTEPNLQGNTIPGFGDHRGAHRQIGTINEVHIFSS
jgi:hypothetical protein